MGTKTVVPCFLLFLYLFSFVCDGHAQITFPSEYEKVVRTGADPLGATQLCENTTDLQPAREEKYVEYNEIDSIKVVSPCFSSPYGEEYPEQVKVTYVNPTLPGGSPSILGYTFTIRQTLLQNDHILYISDNLQTRIYTITGDASATEDNQKVRVVNNIDSSKNQVNLVVGNTFFVDISGPFVAKPYSIRDLNNDRQGIYEYDLQIEYNVCPASELAKCTSPDTAATCERNGLNVYTCVCSDKYTGEFCKDDKDECALGTDECEDSTNCKNLIGNYECNCKEGYDPITNNDKACTDIDECASTEDNDCDAVTTTCRNVPGSFECDCMPGYERKDGTSTKTCTDIDECLDANRCKDGSCENNNGGFICTCNSGFKQNDDKTACIDVNECTETTVDCTNGECVNNNGDYSCTCNAGYTPSSGGKSCEDFDECAVDSSLCANGECVNEDGTYTCTCEKGYKLEDKKCIDVNECDENLHDCTNGDCVNSIGDFSCNCNTGYQPVDDTSKACEDINECIFTGANKVCNNGECTNSPGTYSCTCDDGYTQASDKLSCIDFNECLSPGDHTCAPNGACVNFDGSFTCNCNAGYKLFNKTCIDNDECDATNDPCSPTGVCNNTEGTYTCNCKGGYQNVDGDLKLCEDIDECKFTGIDAVCTKTEEICVDRDGSYECQCDFDLNYRKSAIENQCDYYCPSDNIQCVENQGFVEMPNKESKTDPEIRYYELDFVMTWKFPAAGTGNGYKFVFIKMDTEPKQDRVIFGNGADPQNFVNYKVQFSGDTEEFYSGVDITGDINKSDFRFDNSTKTVYIGGSEVFIFFTSDPTNDRDYSGFLLSYMPDEDDCTIEAQGKCEGLSECEDGLFTYTCEPCESGFGGQHCDIDINECVETPDICWNNSVCNNAIGNYTCDCVDGYREKDDSGAKSCEPYFELGNLQVVDLGSNDINVTFSILHWDGSLITDYITSVQLDVIPEGGVKTTIHTINSEDIGQTYQISTKPFTKYTILVEIAGVGSDYDAAFVDFSQQIKVTTNSIAPAKPTVTITNDAAVGRFYVNWVSPPTTEVGLIESYEIRYRCSDCNKYLYPNNEDNGEYKYFSVDDNFLSYVITNVERHRTYEVSVRAKTAGGFGEYSDTFSVSTGVVNEALAYKMTSTAADFDTYPASVIRSDNYGDGPYGHSTENSNFQYWLYDSSSQCKGSKFNVKNFATEKEEDIVYYGVIGSGEIATITDHDTYNNPEYEKGMLSGQLSDLPSTMPVLTREAMNASDDVTYIVFHPDANINDKGFEIEVLLDCNSCAETPAKCLHSGVCTDGDYSYTCNCDGTDYQGEDCRYPKAAITSFACPEATAEARKITCNWDVTDLWEMDETVIKEFTISYNIKDSTEVMTQTATAHDSSAVIMDLKPYTEYEFKIKFDYHEQFNSFNLETPATVAADPVTTKADVPEAPVGNIQFSDIESTSVKVSYTASPTPNGAPSHDITLTQMTLRDGDTAAVITEAAGSALEGTVTGLFPYTEYSAVVTVKTSAGSFPSNPVNFTTITAVPLTISTPAITELTSTSFKVCWTVTGTGRYPGPTTYTVVTTDVGLPGDAPTKIVPSDPDELCVEVEELEEHQQYSVTVMSETADAAGTTTGASFITTPAAVPGPVASITRVSGDETSLTIRFTPPTDLDKNGEITGYTVSNGGPPVPANAETDFKFNGLSTYTLYEITVVATNGAGSGIATTESFYSGDGTPNAVVLSAASFTISDTHITANWDPPTPIVGKYSYMVTLGKESETTDLTTASFEGLSPGTDYTFTIKVQTEQDKKESAVSTFVARTSDGKPEPVKNIRTSSTPNTITVTWDDPNVTNGKIINYVISWNDGTEDKTANSDDRTYTIEGLTPEKNYSISVQASTSKDTGDKSTVEATTADGFASKPTLVSVTGSTNVDFTVTPGEGVAGVTVTEHYLRYSEDTERCNEAEANTCKANAVSNRFDGASFQLPLSDLDPWRIYSFKVVAVSNFDRETESDPITVNTPEAAPAPAIVSTVDETTKNSTKFMWEIGKPLKGADTTYSYAVTKKSDGTQIESDTLTVDSAVAVTGLSPGVTYVITITSSNVAGATDVTKEFNTLDSEPEKPVEPVNEAPTNNTVVVSWSEPSVPNGVITNYVVTVTCIESSATNGCTGLDKTESVTGDKTTATISELAPETTYEVTVTAYTSAGAGEATEPISFTTEAGELRSTNEKPFLPGSPGSITMIIANPCENPEQYFVTNQGKLNNVYISIKEAGGVDYDLPARLSRTYNDATNEDPVGEYITFDSNCKVQREGRKKRELINNNQNITIGAEKDCSDQTGICNGELKPNTEYQVRFTGENSAGSRVSTPYSEPFKTGSTGGLTAGEIAAIVICSVLFIILLILLIVFCVRRKKMTGKRNISTKSSKHYDNAGFDDSARTQKYEVDPAAAPTTEYSTSIKKTSDDA